MKRHYVLSETTYYNNFTTNKVLHTTTREYNISITNNKENKMTDTIQIGFAWDIGNVGYDDFEEYEGYCENYELPRVMSIDFEEWTVICNYREIPHLSVFWGDLFDNEIVMDVLYDYFSDKYFHTILSNIEINL